MQSRILNKMTKIKTLPRLVGCLFLTAVMALSYIPAIVAASPIMNRSVVIGSSAASATTTYSLLFTVPSSTPIKSASFAACTTAGGVCTPAPGFSASSSTLADQPTNLGAASGWTANTATVNELRILNSSNSTAPSGNQVINFANVINPNTTNSTFYIRITTFSDNAWTNVIDTGIVASSTAGQVTVSVNIDEALTFTLASSSVSLSTPTIASTGSGTSSMTVSTNATRGYSVAYSGDTLKSGANSLTAMAASADSTLNSKQFGINLMSNTTPAIGSDKSGSGIGTPSTGYDAANKFKFNTAGETIATASAPTNTNTFTTSYIANMDGSTAAGVYSTILTYTATANF